MNTLTTTFIKRLRDRDEAAWFELWETFGPVIRSQLTRWGRGYVGLETVRDLTQETLAELSKSIHRFDPERGVRFSTWLLAIARHCFGDEMDRRNASKRGSGRRPGSLFDGAVPESRIPQPEKAYEHRVFLAKVHAAVRQVESEADFIQFQVYRMRVFENQPGRTVSAALGISEPTVSRHLGRIRNMLRMQLESIITMYSFTKEELQEPLQAGLVGSDTMFDDALSELHVQHSIHEHKDQAGIQLA